MTFVHQDPEFDRLLRIVAQDREIDVALVEKDYWVTHSLWALHQTGLDLWFKGGTSLSKGFGLIQRFSEDLDLMIEPGSVPGMPRPGSVKNKKMAAVERRHAYFDALVGAMVIPDVQVERDRSRLDEQARGAEYLARYPGRYLGHLAPAMLPFVKLEVGQARVVPCVARPLGSFVHTYLETKGQLGAFSDNRPGSVRCVHPVVTLFEKLDALMRRYPREVMEPDTFVRHYEDAAQIVRSIDGLPDPGRTPAELMQEMIESGDLQRAPTPEEPSLVLEDPEKRRKIAQAYVRISPMYWGPRMGLEEACEVIRGWLGG
ncbi:MAG: nucleotidyl transferase AbiEii/AbiGii toxin family protein [Deltaproteobacteria bacterium]|nr:nucleotidyl transferase AbiEii/AbiGii toxin family protein [Deltaproteobacteria bacterium]